MPKEGLLYIDIYPDGKVAHDFDLECKQIATAYQVPAHGRLVDCDAFSAEMKERQNEAGKWLRDAKDHDTAVRADAVLSFLCEVKLTLDKLPTVIPEEDAYIEMSKAKDAEDEA